MYITWTNPDYSTRIGFNTRLKVYAQNVYATATQPAMKKYHSVYWLIPICILWVHIFLYKKWEILNLHINKYKINK